MTQPQDSKQVDAALPSEAKPLRVQPWAGPWTVLALLNERERLERINTELLAALEKINEWCCYASEEDTSQRGLVLMQIGIHVRTAIAKVSAQ